MQFRYIGKAFSVTERTNCYLVENKEYSLYVRVHKLPEDIKDRAIYFNVVVDTNFCDKYNADYLVTELSKELNIRKNRFKLNKESSYKNYEIIYNCPTLADLNKFEKALTDRQLKYWSFKRYTLFRVLQLLPTREAVERYELKCRLAGLWIPNEAHRLDDYDGYFIDTGVKAARIDGKYYRLIYDNTGAFKFGDIIE